MKNFILRIIVLTLYGISHVGVAQHAHLHTESKWEECSIQLDPSLTQEAWRQFTKEAGLVTYFRPLTDAKPMGKLNFEISLLQWATAIDNSDDAWNNTFVHPDSAHWLFEGSRLAFPGLTARVGITNKLDAGVYFTKNPGANYGFYGGQLQYNILNDPETKWSTAARASFTSLYGPDDVNLTVYGVDLLASKEFKIYSDWASVSPYAGVSTYFSNSHEKTEAVSLHNEHVLGGQAMVGAVLKLSIARVAVEYNFARVNTLSLKLGIAF
jgi:hypothetical protein